MSNGLRKQGIDIGRNAAGSLMLRLELHVKSRKRCNLTTDSKHDLLFAPNHLDRYI
jgi:hypothetical protein